MAESQKVVIQVELWEDQLPKVNKLAKQFHQSVGKVIRDAVADYLDRNLEK